MTRREYVAEEQQRRWTRGEAEAAQARFDKHYPFSKHWRDSQAFDIVPGGYTVAAASTTNKAASPTASHPQQRPNDSKGSLLWLVLNTGDDLYRSTAMTVNLDIDIKYALESLEPGHRDVSFSG